MTWQSIINGATGIQYFVRQGLNYFPKSVAHGVNAEELLLKLQN